MQYMHFWIKKFLKFCNTAILPASPQPAGGEEEKRRGGGGGGGGRRRGEEEELL